MHVGRSVVTVWSVTDDHGGHCVFGGGHGVFLMVSGVHGWCLVIGGDHGGRCVVGGGHGKNHLQTTKNVKKINVSNNQKRSKLKEMCQQGKVS